MRVVLIGAYGQLGTDLRLTKPHSIELFCPKRNDLDITVRDKVREYIQAIKPQVVVNCAAYVKVDQAEEEIDKAFMINAIGVRYLVEEVGKNTIILHISTDYVFDGAKYGKPYYEDDRENPINIYGLSKYTGELILKNYHDRYYIVRSSSLYGVVGASGKGGNFPYTIIKKAKAGEPLKVVDDIFMVPTHTYDLAQAIWRLVTDGFPFGIYHITHTGYCSWYEFAKAVLETAGIQADITPIKSDEFPTKARRPKWSVLGTKKGLQLSHWREGLEGFIIKAKGAGKI